LSKALVHPITNIFPPVRTYRIELFVIGVQLSNCKTVSQPVVEVAWGRQDTDKNENIMCITPKKHRFTATGISDKLGYYGFMEKIVLSPCNLACDPHHQEWLDIRLLGEKEDDHDLFEVKTRSYVHLTKQLSGLPGTGFPCLRAPFFQGFDDGSQQIIGYMDYLIRILDRKRHKENKLDVQKENAAFEERVTQLMLVMHGLDSIEEETDDELDT